MITKNKFDSLIKLASQPLKASKGRKKKVRRSAGYNGKKTHSHSVEGISGKQNGKSHE